MPGFLGCCARPSTRDDALEDKVDPGVLSAPSANASPAAELQPVDPASVPRSSVERSLAAELERLRARVQELEAGMTGAGTAVLTTLLASVDATASKTGARTIEHAHDVSDVSARQQHMHKAA